MSDKKAGRYQFWSPQFQITINLALTALSIALACITVWLMHKSNLSAAISTYSSHQPMLAVDNDTGLSARLTIPPRGPDSYDARVRFTIKNLGTGVARNVNYAVLNFLDGREVGSTNISSTDGKIIRVDYSLLPGGSVQINYDEKSSILQEMISRDNNKDDCVAIVLSYEQHNLDGTVIPRSYLQRIRPYWVDRKTKELGWLSLEQTHSSSMPLGLELSDKKLNSFQPTRHKFPAKPGEDIVYTRKE